MTQSPQEEAQPSQEGAGEGPTGQANSVEGR